MCLVLFTGRVLIEISITHKKLNETLDENVRGQLLYFKKLFLKILPKTQIWCDFFLIFILSTVQKIP